MLGSTLSAAAANTKAHTITIENSRDGHVYEAYQVFSGEWSREGTGESAVNFLSNVDWGSGTDGPALLAELKGDGILGEFFAEADSAAACAEVLEELGKTASGDQLLDRFAELAWKHHGEKAGESTETESPYTIDVSGDGYYLVKDKDPASGTYPEGELVRPRIFWTVTRRGTDIQPTAATVNDSTEGVGSTFLGYSSSEVIDENTTYTIKVWYGRQEVSTTVTYTFV